MKKITIIILVVIFLGLVVFFFPKSGGDSSEVCRECEVTECKCFGFEKTIVYPGTEYTTCFGIPHSCKTIIPWSE